MNSDTVDIVLQELMERGIKTKGGEQIGKTILQVKAQERMVKRIADDSEYLDGASLEELERIRVTLRGLIRFIADSNARRTIITDLKDPIIARVEGQDSTSPNITRIANRKSIGTSMSIATMMISESFPTTSLYSARTSRIWRTL